MDDRSAGLAIFVCATALFAYYTVWVLVTPFVEPGHVVLSWFPKYNLNELPWNIAAWPTEPILKPTRRCRTHLYVGWKAISASSKTVDSS